MAKLENEMTNYKITNDIAIEGKILVARRRKVLINIVDQRSNANMRSVMTLKINMFIIVHFA